MRQITIHLHEDAPAKPAIGAACNGCGVCCAYAPCPLGMLLSARRRGPCVALRWDDRERRHRCAALDGAGPIRSRLVGRWIAAGRGCDSALDVVREGSA